MNENIKELAKRATTQYSPAYYSEKWTEKFAELIVRECAKVGFDNSYPGRGVVVKTTILEHFGVEP